MHKLNWAWRAWGWCDELDDCPPDTLFEMRALGVWGRARYLSVTVLNIYEWAEKKHFVSLKLEGQSRVRTRDLRHSKQATLTTAPGPPPFQHIYSKKTSTLSISCWIKESGWINVGSASQTVAQHEHNMTWTSHAYCASCHYMYNLTRIESFLIQIAEPQVVMVFANLTRTTCMSGGCRARRHTGGTSKHETFTQCCCNVGPAS